MRKDNKPKWPIARAIAYGKEALRLGQERKADLEPRLGAGLVGGLAVDLSQLEALETGRPAKVSEVKGLTGTQSDVAAKGAVWVAAVREAVKRRGAGTGLRKAVGVGLRMQPTLAKSVATAVETILAAAKERPDDLRACGILESDLAQGQAILAGLSGARSFQDQGMVEKKDLTEQKNKVQLRVEAAIEAISTAGGMHYHGGDPALAQRFRDLIPPANGGGPIQDAASKPAEAKN